MIRMTVAEFHAAMRAQGMSRREDIAFVCPVCATVQSIASMVRAGVDPAKAETVLGFSCVGRYTGAGGHKTGTPPGTGCNWTLGGLLHLHKLEVVDDDGKRQMSFELATAEDAATLAAAGQLFVHVSPKADACDHDFQSWRELAGGGGEQVCTRCGMGALAHSLRTSP